jgi:hypothetical protein
MPTGHGLSPVSKRARAIDLVTWPVAESLAAAEKVFQLPDMTLLLMLRTGTCVIKSTNLAGFLLPRHSIQSCLPGDTFVQERALSESAILRPTHS